MVNSVNPGIVMRGMSKEGGGVIMPGDALIALDQDDCSKWKLSRYSASLSIAPPLRACVCIESRRG